MAEAVVGAMAENLISLQSSEVRLTRGVHREIKVIKEYYRTIQAVLEDADARAEANYGQDVKLWLQELREVSVQIEIVIDKYTYYVAERRQHPRDQRHLIRLRLKLVSLLSNQRRLSRLRLKLVSLLKQASRSVAKPNTRHDIASNIREIEERVEKINRKPYTFTNEGIGSCTMSNTWLDPRLDPRIESRFLSETEVVGIQRETEKVVALISGSDQLAVVAIVGKGGIGKTTLANQVYEKVKASFDCHVWITVSQTYNKVDLLKSLIRGLYMSVKETAPQGIEQETDLFELTKDLRDYVKGKNYFVSFDDVWETYFWADIKNGLPSVYGKRGRILITTRDSKVVNVCRMSTSLFIHNMELLNFDNSWKLFCSKTFHSTFGNNCPAHLHHLSQLVVKRCDGLPLAIAVIGGLLATKNESTEEWTSLATSFASESAYGFAEAGRGNSDGPAKAWSDPRDDSCFLRDTEVVGIQRETEKVVALISGSDQHAVVAIIGMGGIGKTTLANQVYEKVIASFDCHAWITVSQTYNKVDLLRSLIRKLCKSANETAPQGIEQETDHLELTKALSAYVKGKNYFVSFDDVWETKLWADIENGLPSENGKRGRILITTRDLKVANVCKRSTSLFIRNMELLNFDDSWKLFCSKAFHSTSGNNCSAHLHNLSQSVVKRCEGLPLAIVVIGCLLGTNTETTEQWKSLATSFASKLESNDYLKSINKILSPSYNDLPYNLRPCLLYFGIFPEDYSIRSNRLIRQWIAEGFVKPEMGNALEVVAKRYLMDLINRSIIQASKIDSTGRVKECRVHNVVRDFIVTKMEDLKFCALLSGNNSDLFDGLTTRRVSISNAGNAIGSSDTVVGSCNVGSVFMFGKFGEMCNPLLVATTKSCRQLKVLAFDDAIRLGHLPDDIGNLYLLRYLSLRRTRVKSIPKSIGKLENLETLDLRDSQVYELPSEINMLSKLRNLMVNGLKLEKGFGCLKSLQKLYKIVCGVDTLEELSKLTELRKLGISYLDCMNGQALFHCIQSLKHLEYFNVAFYSQLNSESMSSPHKFLQQLFLTGPLTKLPRWVAGLECLVQIELGRCKLEDYLLEPLQDLPNLLDMKIFLDVECAKLRFATGKFKKLEVLKVSHLDSLNLLEIEQGSLLNLKEFRIGGCPQMKEMSGFHHLKELRVLTFFALPIMLLLSQDFQSLTWVPDIQFHYSFAPGFKPMSLSCTWVLMAQGYVPLPEEDKQEWFSLDFDQLYKKVEQIQSSQQQHETSLV